MAKFRIFIFRMNILNFLVTSRVWSKSFVNEGFGQHRELFLLNAKDSNVRLTKQIVAVVACCSVNQISSTRSHNSRNSSLCMAIFVIFIPNITVIEQYWGAVKFRYCSFRNKPTTIEEMENQVLECLDSISLLQIQR